MKFSRFLLSGIFSCFLLSQCTSSINEESETVLAEIDGYAVSETHFLTSFKNYIIGLAKRLHQIYQPEKRY